MGGNHLLPLLLALAFAACALAQSPEWITTLDKLSLPEDTAVGTTIGRLLAQDPRGLQIFYFVQADMLQVDRDSGNVRLTRPVDFEDVTEKVLKVRMIAVNTEGLENNRDIEITLVDVNDETAKFSLPEYRTTIPEDSSPGITVFRAVSVIDRDLSNSILIVTCNASAKANATREERDLFQEACQKFGIIQTTQSERTWGGNIILNGSLDYETTSSYKVPLQTFDGKNYEVGNFEIFVGDVNDSPPRFVRLQPETVQEGLPKGRPVTWVSAVDTDSTNPRNVTYVFVANPGNFFELDPITGNITTNTTLDRDSPELSRGFVPLIIKAREMLSGGIPGNERLTTVTGSIQINIEDINDNKPTFHETHFNVSIREDIANNSPLPGLIMTITDLDQGTFNNYDLVLLNSTDRFAVFPEQGRERSTASIKVTNTGLIDYERGPIMYILVVEARERLTNSINTGTATVTVHIIDVNDNNPMFDLPPGRPFYNESISEMTPAGRLIVQIRATDPDTGTMGTAGIRYMLVGNGAEKFRIDERTGWVSVGPCTTQPGKPECLDFETQRRYDLTATATDENGSNTGRTNTALLIIHITDENDNSPSFLLPTYTEYIREKNMITVNPLIVRATDPDTVPGRGITYRLGGPESADWIIDPNTGNITARQPIYYTGDGRYTFYVEATDGTNSQTADVTIIVIDENDKQPAFIPSSQYETTIDETYPGNTPVLTVTATDKDDPTTANGIIDFVIERGDQGLFIVNSTSGVISTAPNAKFDYDKQPVYRLVMLARDRGNPQLTGTADVTINIRDANNKNPYFVPSTQQADISEEVSIGTSVLRVSARDPDVNPTLAYYWCGPKSAINSQGVTVNDVTFVENMFAIDRNTGLITTSSRLDRDRASVVTYTMCVNDTSARTELQIGTGTVIITVLEYNSRAPYFEQSPYNITIDEEKPLGSLVRTLVALDDRDAISEYRLISNPGSYFTLSSQTGVLTVNQRIDYEELANPVILLRVEAFDDGRPQRSNTTDVFIYVRNINDNSPSFRLESYVVETLEENPPDGSSVVNVSATDLDKGDYGNVFYALPDGETRFVINNITGHITVRNGSSLDRETQQTIVMQVTAYDSPLDPTVRRSNAVPLYINLMDKNDNPPQFSQLAYFTTIIETINVGSEVLQVLATDLDIGRNALLSYQKVPGSGDPNNYFVISPLFGRITVDKSLRGWDGVYFFRVSVTDNLGNDPYFTAYANVTITVLEATNSPPRWVIPPSDNFTIEVLESQYLGMLVYDVEAEDLDTGVNGVVDYMFYTSNGTTTVTPEFRINPITGVIRAERVYDREEVDRYVLLLLARDRGTPPLESSRYLTVVVLDVNDNVPEFPMANGQTIPVNIPVPENMVPGRVIGGVNATDRDSAVANSKIYYYIIAGNEEGIVQLDRESGNLTLIKSVDRERKSSYSLNILATNNISDYTVHSRRRRSTDPSIVTVNINLVDVNDLHPQFTDFPEFQRIPEEKRYHGCVSRNAPYGRSILRVAATDPDSTGSLGIRFRLQTADLTYFGIDSLTGVIYNQFLSNLPSSVYTTIVNATDTLLSVVAPLEIFVYSPEQEVVLVMNQRPTEVRVFQSQIESTLQKLENLHYVCISRISNHMLGDGTVIDTQTDLYLSGARLVNNNQFQFYSRAELLSLLQGEISRNNSLFTGLYISQVASTEQQESVTDYRSVLAVLIIIILLILLFIILICIACILIKNSKRRKFRKLTAHSLRRAPPPYEGSFQVAKDEPVSFVNTAFEPEPEPPGVQYAVVKKPRPHMDMAPVVIPAEPEEPEEPEPIIVTQVENVQAPPPTWPDNDPGSDHSDDNDGNDFDEPIIVTEVEPGLAETPRSSRRSSSLSSHPSSPNLERPSEPEEEEEFRIETDVM